METTVELKCKYCGEKYNPKETKRIYGKESSVYLLGYCSARCYTKSRTQ